MKAEERPLSQKPEYTQEQAKVYMDLISHDALTRMGIKNITGEWFEWGGRIFLKAYNSCASMFAKNNSGGTDFYVWLQDNIRWVSSDSKEFELFKIKAANQFLEATNKLLKAEQENKELKERIEALIDNHGLTSAKVKLIAAEKTISELEETISRQKKEITALRTGLREILDTTTIQWISNKITTLLNTANKP